jgi:hypothetical protein
MVTPVPSDAVPDTAIAPLSRSISAVAVPATVSEPSVGTMKLEVAIVALPPAARMEREPFTTNWELLRVNGPKPELICILSDGGTMTGPIKLHAALEARVKLPETGMVLAVTKEAPFNREAELKAVGPVPVRRSVPAQPVIAGKTNPELLTTRVVMFEASGPPIVQRQSQNKMS